MQHRRVHQVPKRQAWQAVRFQAKVARPAPGSANSPPVAPEGVRGEPSGGRSYRTLRGAPLATEAAGRANLSREREAADYKALLRRRVRDVTPPLPVVRHSILPWALCPLQGPSGSAPGPGFAKPDKPWSAEALRGPGRPPHRGKPRGIMRPLDPSRDSPPTASPKRGGRSGTGGRSRIRAPHLFSVPSGTRNRAPNPWPAGAGSWRTRCRWSLSEVEVGE